jgi:hypothetical protein
MCEELAQREFLSDCAEIWSLISNEINVAFAQAVSDPPGPSTVVDGPKSLPYVPNDALCHINCERKCEPR